MDQCLCEVCQCPGEVQVCLLEEDRFLWENIISLIEGEVGEDSEEDLIENPGEVEDEDPVKDTDEKLQC